MARRLSRGPLFAVPLLFGALAVAQPRVSIEPRPTRAAARPSDAMPPPDIRVDSTLIQIPVHVTTALGASVTTLGRASFHLFEDGVEQAITQFAQEDGPVSVGLLFDSSGSMQKKMQRSSEAALAFFQTANVEDEFFLVEFNDRAKLSVPFTPDPAEIYQHIAQIKPFGRTSLLDAIHLALEQMRHAQYLRKAIVILSDGGDNRSRYTGAEIKNLMLESDVQLYAMGIFDRSGARKLSPEELNGPRLLDELSFETGGRHYPVDNIDDLAAISARIGAELRSQYLLGYSSSNPARDGKYRRVRLTVTSPADLPALKASYRQGYTAPSN